LPATELPVSVIVPKPQMPPPSAPLPTARLETTATLCRVATSLVKMPPPRAFMPVTELPSTGLLVTFSVLLSFDGNPGSRRCTTADDRWRPPPQGPGQRGTVTG
jgi:hypothetical protein